MAARSFLIYFLVALLSYIFRSPVADSCSPGQFGQNCEFQCHCAGGSTCTDGVCGNSGSCDDAWEGYKCQIGKNVARNKTVSVSSTLPYWKRGGQLAVDGDSNRDFYEGGSCVSTNRERNPWLRVDLGDNYVVQEVTIATVGRDLFYVWDGYAVRSGATRLFPELNGTIPVNFSSCLERCLNTTDCNAASSCYTPRNENGCWNSSVLTWPWWWRENLCKYSVRIDNTLKNLYIRVGNESYQIGKDSLCKSTALTIDGDTEQRVSCDQMVIGRYIFLQLNNTDDGVLAVCEIMVKGYPFAECRRGHHGITCEDACPAGCSTGTTGCNKFNGTCCSQYKTGAQCDKDLPSLNETLWTATNSSESVTVRWKKWIEGSTSTGVGPVNKYRIQYKVKNSNTWTSVDHDAQAQFGQELSKTVTYLNYNTYYSFRVACYLTDGLGDVIGQFTDITDIKTSCNAPSAVVLNANSISSSLSGRFYVNVFVSWSGIRDTASGCDRISGYNVAYKKKGTIYYETVSGSTQPSVTIETLDVYTEYEIKVEAYNNENKTSASNVVVHRTLEGYSDAVQFARVTSSASDQLRVSWNPPKKSRGVITGYKLQTRQVAIGDCDNTVHGWGSEVSVTESEYTINGLLPYRRYDVKIIPVNGAGDGTSHNISESTAQSVPSGVPAHVQSIERTKRSAVFQWKEVPCGERNGVVKEYRARLLGLQYSSVTQTVQTNINRTSITSLTPYARYSFKVAAVTEAGGGTLFSDDVIFRTLDDVPPAPRHVTIPNSQSTSVDVEWTAPYPPHGEIQKYQVRYGEVTKPPVDQITDSNVTSYLIKNLDANVNYSIRVRARTVVGWGNWSEDAYGFTVQGVPSEPRSFRVTNRNVTSLSFSWEEPKYPNGKIAGYKLRCNEEKTEVAGTSLESTITGLKAGSRYVCSIQVRTETRYGKISPAVTVWTLPQKPKLFSIISSTKSSIMFQWEVDPHTSGLIDFYKVTCEYSKHGVSDKVEITTDKQSVEMSGLQSDTFYQCFIQGRSKYGYGEKSSIVGVWTKSDGDIPVNEAAVNIPAVVTGCVLTVVCILSILITVFILRYKRRRDKKAGQDQQYMDLPLPHVYSNLQKSDSDMARAGETNTSTYDEYDNATENSAPTDRAEEPVIYMDILE